MINKKLKVGNVPNLRFPLYKNKWECKKIKDILKNIYLKWMESMGMKNYFTC